MGEGEGRATSAGARTYGRWRVVGVLLLRVSTSRASQPLGRGWRAGARTGVAPAHSLGGDRAVRVGLQLREALRKRQQQLAAERERHRVGQHCSAGERG